MRTLEEVIIGSPFLSRIKENGLAQKLPLNNRDVTIKYLQKTLLIVEKSGLNPQQFLEQYRAEFSISTVLETELASPNRWINRWIYRSFMESAREMVEYSPKDFYERVFAETFSDHEDAIISIANFLDLGFILKNMNRQNHQWTTLTEQRHERKKSKRGKITIIRNTLSKHKTELRELFGEEAAKTILLEDCIATKTAYQTIFQVIRDPKAKIISHPNCEANGDPYCEYQVEYTPIPLRTTLQRGIIYLLSKIIPELGTVLKKHKEMINRNFRLQDEIDQETRHTRELYHTLEEVADASRRSARHEVVNYERARNSKIEESITSNARNYFLALKDISTTHQELNELFKKLNEKLFIPSLTKLETPTKNELDGELGEIISPFVEEKEREQTAFTLTRLYREICSEFITSLNTPTRNILKPILEINPFPIEVYYQGLDTSANVISAFEEQAEQIRATMEGIKLPLDQILITAEKQASQAKGKKIDITYHLEQQISIPKPLTFIKVVRDLFFNVIDYANGKADIYTGHPPSERIKILKNVTPLESEPTDYLKITDYGQGMPPEKIEQTNNYLFERTKTITTTEHDRGNAGTRDLQNYLISVRNERKIYCLYTSILHKGTTIEFFFSKITPL